MARPRLYIAASILTFPRPAIFNTPLEIRNHILSYIIRLDYSIPIGDHPSYMDKCADVSERPLQHFKSLVLVNKQLYEEANHFFYSRNSFTVGTGDTFGGSLYNLICPTYQRFADFIDMVPPQHISLIKDVRFHVHLRESRRKGIRHGKERFGLGTIDDICALHHIATSIGRYFAGLRKLHVAVGTTDGAWNCHKEDFDGNDDEKHIAKIINKMARGSENFAMRVEVCDRFEMDNIRYYLDQMDAYLRHARTRPSFKLKSVAGFYSESTNSEDLLMDESDEEAEPQTEEFDYEF